MPRYFSVAEVNAILPAVAELMGDLLTRRGKVARQIGDLKPILSDRYSNTGSAQASAVVQDFIAIERLIDEVEAYGCKIKNLNAGTIDFLSQYEGRDVWLCWRYGEKSQLEYFHGLTAGFHGRRPIIDPDDFWTEDDD